MKLEIEKINKRNVIRLSNSMNTIVYNLSAVALDILYSLFANIRREDEELFAYEITIKELENKLGRKINKNSLTNALNELAENEVYFLFNPEIKFKLLEVCEHIVADSILTIKLNDMLKEYLLNLEKEFFKINLNSFLKLKNRYSKILYCILCQYKNMKKIKIKVEDLKKLLDVPITLNSYGNFKQRVLNPTLEFLKNLDEFDYINFKEYKKVKSVVEIEFILIQDDYLRRKEEKKIEAEMKKKPKFNFSKEKNISYINDWIDGNTDIKTDTKDEKRQSFIDSWIKSQ